MSKSLKSQIKENPEKEKRCEIERKIWNKYIQPLIDKCDLDHKYECMEWNPNWIEFKGLDKYATLLLIKKYGPAAKEKYELADVDPDWINKEGKNFVLYKPLLALRLVHGHQSFETSFMRNDETYHHGTLDLIEWLRNRTNEEKRLPLTREGNYPRIQREDVLPFFKTHMRLHFEYGTLPYLLKQLALQYNFTSKFFLDEERKKQQKCQMCGEYFIPSKVDPRIKYCPICSTKSKMTKEQRREYQRSYRKKEGKQKEAHKTTRKEIEIKNYMKILSLSRKEATDLWKEENM